MDYILWLFPLVFMFHDFEEIIFIKPWINRNRTYLEQRFPGIAQKLAPHLNNLSTSAFAPAVAEEFLLISIVTVFSYKYGLLHLWFNMFPL